MYEFKYRMDDPQTGRFWQIDPLANKYVYNSTYTFSEDKVINSVELEGLEATMAIVSEYYEARDKAKTSEGAQGAKEFDQGAATAGKVIQKAVIGATAIIQPEIGIPLMVADLSGVPITPSPQAFASAAVEGAGAPILDEIGNPVAAAPSEETMTLFRGVNENHVGYADALEGTALPQGGNARPAQHNEGNTASEYTSWTTDPEVALNYALRPKGTGVVLKTEVPSSTTVASPSGKSVLLKQSGHVVNEQEVLLQGAIYGTTVTKP